jgi:hypothetical protein
MKRSTGILVGATALLVAGAVAMPFGSAGASPKRVHLVLTESSTAFHFIDAPAAAEDGQAGDLITFESDLSNASGKVGTLEGHCVQVRADGSLDDCEVTVTIGANSFRMAGPFDPTTGSPLTVLGGTGAWVGIGGVDSIANQPDGTSIHTIDLVKL